MAQPPLLQLSDIGLGFGGDPLFEDLSLVIQQGDRLALVGRNGSGKSTLLKVMAGLVEPDRGSRTVPAGTSVGYMEQEPEMTGCATLGDFALRDLGPSELWRVEAAAEGLFLIPDAAVGQYTCDDGGAHSWDPLLVGSFEGYGVFIQLLAIE